MADCNTILQTAAAVGSAVAAIAAVVVAKSTFSFQRNSLLKKAICDQILALLKQLYYLKSLTSQGVLGAADEEVVGLKGRISEARESALVLKCMVPPPTSGHAKKVHDLLNDLCEDDVFARDQNTPNAAASAQLDDAIDALQRVYRAEIK